MLPDLCLGALCLVSNKFSYFTDTSIKNSSLILNIWSSSDNHWAFITVIYIHLLTS